MTSRDRWLVMRRALRLLVACALAGVSPAARAAEVDRASPADQSPTQVNERVTDPVSATWSLKLKNTLTFQDVGTSGDHAQYQLEFQPTMPVWLTDRWKLIVRPDFTFVDDVPYAHTTGGIGRTTGFGDTVLDLVVSPELEPWLLAVGPTFTFPTASLDLTGAGKWQIGPACSSTSSRSFRRRSSSCRNAAVHWRQRCVPL